MKGLKSILFGICIILIGGFILIDQSSSFGGIVELALFATGIGFAIKGLNTEE